MKVMVQKAIVSHETAFINGVVFVIELQPLRVEWAIMIAHDGEATEPVARYTDKREAEEAATKLRAQLTAMARRLQ